MEEPDRSSNDARSPWWRPHFSRAVLWLVGAVLTAAIGVLVPFFLTDWLSGGDGPEETPPTVASTPTSTPAAVPESRLVRAESIGFYLVEADGSAQGATDALGQPRTRERQGTECTMTWGQQEVIMLFTNFGGADPCVYGSFCTAHVGGRDWSTAEGLQPGMPVRRMLEIYPNAKKVNEAGEITRYVLDPGIELCGMDAKGGLEAWTNVGRVFSLRVSFQAGGD
jgi:hypothetical protein